MTELRISGGDTRLATWNRVKADVLGIPVRTVPGDAAVTGVAMLAGLGAGVYRDPAEAIARCVRPDAAGRARPGGGRGLHRGPGLVPRPARLGGRPAARRLTMRARLGINTCFAVKRWPEPEDWAPIVADRLGLGLVQHSLDLEDGRRAADDGTGGAGAIRAATETYGLTVHSTFTGLAAYSRNLLLDPEPVAREEARTYLRGAVDLTAALGGVATGGHVGAFGVADWTDPERRAIRWADLQASLAGLARACSAGRSRVPHGREPRRRPRAVDDGDDRRPADRG